MGCVVTAMPYPKIARLILSASMVLLFRPGARIFPVLSRVSEIMGVYGAGGVRGAGGMRGRGAGC
jgi:hypothetical protein